VALTDIRNFVPLDDRLATAGQPTEAQLREVAAAGYDVVINLGLTGTDYALPDEAGLAGALGVEYHHLPVQFDSPRVEELRRFAALMDAARDRKVFVHCAANYRVSAFVSLYGQLRLGWTPAAADAHMRRLWAPNATWLAFADNCRRELGLEAPATPPP
jgi:uncharacterized protein (TIGR01244 family)